MVVGSSIHWEVTDRTGTIYYYGETAASRQDDPTNPAHIFKWCLDKVLDTTGNYMIYSYTKDTGEIYPSQIAYTGNGSLAPTNTVSFAWVKRTRHPPSLATAFV